MKPLSAVDELPSAADRLQELSLLDRLITCQRTAERAGRHAEAAALNTVIVSVSEAKHKARQARGMVDPALFSLLDEVEEL